MFKVLTALGAMSTASAGACNNCFNILSLDGGKYKGLMTAKFVDFLEEKSFNIAKRELSEQCFVKNVKERVEALEGWDIEKGIPVS